MKKFEIRYANNSGSPSNYEYFTHSFPHLEDLDIFNHGKIEIIDNITKMFRLNPQLKILRTMERIDQQHLNVNFFQNLIENFQNLEILQIWGNTHFFDNHNNDVLFFANIKYFDICLMKGDNEPAYDDAPLPFVFNKLESFSIAYPNDLMNEHFYHFIDKHSTIKKIQLHIMHGLNSK